jgi:hypothetical protein
MSKCAAEANDEARAAMCDFHDAMHIIMGMIDEETTFDTLLLMVEQAVTLIAGEQYQDFRKELSDKFADASCEFDEAMAPQCQMRLLLSMFCEILCAVDRKLSI